MTAIIGRILVLPAVLVAREGPAEHCRNALMTLAGLEATHPGLYALNPELARAARRIHAAVVMLEHSGPAVFAASHIGRAIDALLDAPIDWKVCPAIGCACARLLRGLYMLEG